MFRIGGGLAGALLLATSATAQQQAVERYERMVTELDARYQQLRASANELDAMLAVENSRVEIPVAGMTFTIEGPYAGAVEEAAPVVEARLRTRFGRAVRRLDGARFHINIRAREITQAETTLGHMLGFRQPRTSTWFSVAVTRGNELVSRGGTRADRAADALAAQLTTRLETAAVSELQSTVDQALLDWTGRKTEPLPDFNFRPAYRELVSSPFAVVRACRTDAAQCLPALGLTDSADPTDWYPGSDLHVRVGDMMHRGSTDLDLASLYWMSPADIAVLQSCHDGSRSGCAEFLAGWTLGPPASGNLRWSVFETALRMGGDEAVMRVFEASGNVRERLEHIAGTSIDRVVNTWLETVNASAGRPLTVPLRTGLMALMWIGAFAGLSLRSTRWR